MIIPIQIDTKYNIHEVDGAHVKIASSPSVNGWLEMGAAGSIPISHSRMRLGEDPDDSKFDAMPFSASKFVCGKTRIAVNMANHLHLTVGFVGRNDPDNVAAALYRPNSGWLLQTVVDGGQPNLASTAGVHGLVRFLA